MEKRKSKKGEKMNLKCKIISYVTIVLLSATIVLGMGFICSSNVSAAEKEEIPVFDSYQEAVEYIGKMNALCIRKDKESLGATKISFYDPDYKNFKDTLEGRVYYSDKFNADTGLETCKALGDPHGKHLNFVYPVFVSIGEVISYEEDTELLSLGVFGIGTYNEDKASKEAEFQDAADELLNALDLDGLSDYEKTFRIYRWISNNVKYSFDVEYNSQTAYSALIERKCVCAGYADLLYCLLNKVGIDTYYDSGNDHAWNVVKMDGQYYYCDPTNDKAGSKPRDYPYRNFLMGLESRSTTLVAGNGEDIEGYQTPTGKYFAETSEMNSGKLLNIPEKDYEENTIIQNKKCDDDTHSYEWVKTLPATCKHGERKLYLCRVCGSDYMVEEAAEKGSHKYTCISVAAGLCTEKKEKIYLCDYCGDKITEIIPATEHTMILVSVTEPTCTENGKKVWRCKNCDYDTTEVLWATGVSCDDCNGTKTETIPETEVIQKNVTSTVTHPRPVAVKLSSSVYTYNGKTRKPSVSVLDSAGEIIPPSCYSVSYASGRKKIGRYKVTVVMKGDYSGKLTAFFVIRPKSTSISKVTAATKGFTVKYGIQKVSGYQIQYGRKSSFKGAKTVKIRNYKTTSKKITKLSSGKKYYIRVRTYKKVGNRMYYSAWSKGKKVKTK